MDQIFEFIIENWKWLLEIAFAIAGILVVVLKRKVKVFDSIKEIILSVLPAYISVAENSFDDGQVKKSFVLSSIQEFLENKFGNIDMDLYIDFIEDSIESILSTPQKKGVKR